ncbi:MAG: hypothetical protein RMJ07_01505 [Nitrososphaerota archaeon]|nr:hypothetical protein [Candidatus Bathyarchaeota archaeon]MDW8048346.1 hypothetical protein [Nitrososphaerota archaeon]
MSLQSLCVNGMFESRLSGSEMLGFTVSVVDRLIGGLRWGDFILLYNSRICHVISEVLFLHYWLRGGLGSSAVFVDGGNVFDPYIISESARMLGLDPEAVLRNIWVSRAFTSYQMTNLLVEGLPRVIDQKGSRLVMVSDVTSLYCDPELERFEAKKTFNTVTCYLWNLAKEKRIIVVATSPSEGAKRKRCLEYYLLGRADVAVRVDEGNCRLRLVLEKHPSKPPASVDLYLTGCGGQSLLEDFLGV